MSGRMKQLKSTCKDLKDLFGREISVKHVLEELQSCRAEENAATVRKQMEELDFDVMGIDDKGKVDGYVEQLSLGSGRCREYKKKFSPSELIEESTTLLEVFSALHDAPRKFVKCGDRVTGIVTRGDLQKAPVRMWLFGLVTILEMHLLRLIRNHYPKDSWKVHLSDKRITEAEKLLDLRKKRNEAIDLADCLQFCDKTGLVVKIPEISKAMRKRWATCAKSWVRTLKSAEELRNRLCHAQDIVEGSTWPEVIDQVKRVESFLEFFEFCE